MKLRSITESQDQIAPEWLGSYARTAVTWIEGNYLTLRPASSSTSSIYAYLTELRWDEKQTCLAFQETERVDGEYAQTGVVSVPHQTGHVYLVTSKHGQYRLAILSRPSIKGEMFGILTTLQTGRGSQLLPIATAIALVPQPPSPRRLRWAVLTQTTRTMRNTPRYSDALCRRTSRACLRRLFHQLASDRPRDQFPRVLDAVERHEAAEAGAFFFAEQDLVEHVEPALRHAD